MRKVISSTSPQIDAPMLKLSICHRTSKQLDKQYYVMSSTDQMRKLMDFICKRWHSSIQDARFVWDGERINASDTMESLGMKDGDQIDFFTEQPGGRDSIKKNRTEAPYQIDGCQNFQRLGTVAQNQIGFMENAQPVADAEDNPGSQTAACLSSGNAEMQIIGGLSNGRVDSEQVRPHAEATGGAETAQADIAVASQLANQTNNLPSTGGVKMRHSAPGCPPATRIRQHVTIRVVDINSLNELEFRMGTNTRMGKLMSHVCERWGISAHRVRFTFLGERIQKDETSSTLEMQDGDRIEVFHEMYGGEAPQCVRLAMDQPAKQIA